MSFKRGTALCVPVRSLLVATTVVAVGLCALAAPALGSFGAATNFAAGTGPTDVAIGNLNSDANPDLAVANSGSNNVSILLGNGAGSFGAATNFAAGSSPKSVAIGNLNGDAKPDLAVANKGSGNVSVLLGNGAGSFGAATNFAAGTGPSDVAIGNLSGDANLDLAVANGGGVSILLGNGAGSFGGATNFATTAGYASTSVAIGNLNGDTNPDLAVANVANAGFPVAQVSILLGNGAGSVGAATNLYTGLAASSSVAIGNVRGDSNPDLAVANASGGYATGELSIMLGNGTGSFGAATSFGNTGPTSVAIGSLNGDANPDLAVAFGQSYSNGSNSGNVSPLLGNGAGSFVPATPLYAAGVDAASVAIGNLNGDANPDLAVANSGSGNVSVLLNIGPPTVPYVSPTEGATGVGRTAPVVAVFDRAMNKASAEAAFSLKRSGDGAAVSGSFGWYGNALIFTPNTPLANQTSYTATVNPIALDPHFDPLAAPKTWQFTTATQPLITTVVPGDGATEVLPNNVVLPVFDTAMDKPSAQAAFSLKRTSDGAPVSGSFGWYGNGLIFKPNADLAGATQYTASVTTAAKDLAGHPLPAAKTWRFTTTNRPIIDSVHPLDGATAVPRSNVTLAVFNKAMDKPSAQAAFSLKRTSDGAPVSGSFVWWGNVLIFTPSSPLAANTQYTAAVAGTAKDLAAHTLANPTTWRYTTGSG